MDELALNILDIAYNSIRANASLIEISIKDSIKDNEIIIQIKDNGDGMTPEQVEKVASPFYTTRTTRPVGLGIPLLKQSAELTGGYLIIESSVHFGTLMKIKFQKNHIDTPMMGNLAETIVTLIQAHENIDYLFQYQNDNINFIVNTKSIKDVLENVKINEPEVIVWLKEFIKEGLGK